MTNKQDMNSNGDAGPGKSRHDGAQNSASEISTPADALSESSLDDVSGGSWPYNNAVRASIGATGGGG